MKILIVTPYYPPDLGPSAPLIGMLAEDAAQQGEQVTIIAAVPHYPSGSVAPAYRKKWLYTEKKRGLMIYRVWVPGGSRSNLLHRLLTFLVFQLLATLIGIRQQYDVLMLTNPAIETGLPYFFLGWLRRKPCLLCVWDMYPEVMQRMGIVRNKALLEIVRFFEDITLRGAHTLHVFHPNFIHELKAHDIPAEKIVVIPPWIDTTFLRPLPKQNTFSIEFGLAGTFNLLYAGNFGFSQGLEDFLEVAALLQEEEDFRFVLIGDGTQRQAIEERLEKLGLRNIVLLPFQPRERLPEILATADISLISLRSGLLDGSIPSKTFPLLASGRPILAAVDPGCGIWSLMEISGAGMCVSPVDKRRIAEKIIQLKSDSELRDQLGRKAREFAVANYDRLSACKAFLDTMENMRTRGRIDGY
jgi:colanic acid biosynthesis glycosyl transferase WcaI